MYDGVEIEQEFHSLLMIISYRALRSDGNMDTDVIKR